jgi:hypothetical protein
MSKENRWRRVMEEGTEWEARVVAGPAGSEPDGGEGEMLEFVCVDGSRKSRRIAIGPGRFSQLDDEALHRAFVQARPIGGDHYGRPGKPMKDSL